MKTLSAWLAGIAVLATALLWPQQQAAEQTVSAASTVLIQIPSDGDWVLHYHGGKFTAEVYVPPATVVLPTVPTTPVVVLPPVTPPVQPPVQPPVVTPPVSKVELTGPVYAVVIAAASELNDEQSEALLKLRTWVSGNADKAIFYQFEPEPKDEDGEADKAIGYTNAVPAGKSLPYVFLVRSRKDTGKGHFIWQGELPAIDDLTRRMEESWQ